MSIQDEAREIREKAKKKRTIIVTGKTKNDNGRNNKKTCHEDGRDGRDDR